MPRSVVSYHSDISLALLGLHSPLPRTNDVQYAETKDTLDNYYRTIRRTRISDATVVYSTTTANRTTTWILLLYYNIYYTERQREDKREVTVVEIPISNK